MLVDKIMVAEMMVMMMALTWFIHLPRPSSPWKWFFRLEMDDALAVQSFLSQRLVGLLAESPAITGSQPWAAGWGCQPPSLLFSYSSYIIRDQSRKSG